MQFYFLTWQRCFDFSGRSSREEFWKFMLIHTLVTIVCIAADITMETWFDIIYSLISFIPMISSIIRRLHDIGKSGYWGLLFFIPIIGLIWLIILLALPSCTQNDKEVFA